MTNEATLAATITTKSRRLDSFPNANQNSKHSATGANTSATAKNTARD